MGLPCPSLLGRACCAIRILILTDKTVSLERDREGLVVGIFDYFKRLTKSASATEGNAALELTTRRYHTRYQLVDHSMILLEHPRGGLFRVIDLSFNGCLVHGVADASLDAVVAPFMIDLSIVGKIIRIEVAEVQKRRQGWGLVFRHEGGSDGSMVQLSKVLDPLRCGASAIQVSPENATDIMKSRLRKRFSGEGPFDLLIERDSAGKLAFAMITIRRGPEYGSVIWENGVVITKLNVDSRGVGARMAQTAEPDRELVWTCTVACLGIKFQDGAVIAHLLFDWLSRP